MKFISLTRLRHFLVASQVSTWNMKNIKVLIFILLLIVPGMNSCTWLKTKTATITAYNAKPYTTFLAIYYKKNTDSSFIESYVLRPGEIVNLSVNFFDVEPSFLFIQDPLRTIRNLKIGCSTLNHL